MKKKASVAALVCEYLAKMPAGEYTTAKRIHDKIKTGTLAAVYTQLYTLQQYRAVTLLPNRARNSHFYNQWRLNKEAFASYIKLHTPNSAYFKPSLANRPSNTGPGRNTNRATVQATLLNQNQNMLNKRDDLYAKDLSAINELLEMADEDTNDLDFYIEMRAKLKTAAPMLKRYKHIAEIAKR